MFLLINASRRGFGFYGIEIPWKVWGYGALALALTATHTVADHAVTTQTGADVPNWTVLPWTAAGLYLAATNFSILGKAANMVRGK